VQIIDFLRGLAIIVMIITHTTAFFPHDKIASAIWNWSHFAVPIFIFCSSYLFFKKSSDEASLISSNKPSVTPQINGAKESKSPAILPYLKKRIIRLLIPYYIFLFFFLLSLLLFTPKILTAKYIVQSIFLIGGTDLNWLVLLFLYIAILLPFIDLFFKRNKVLFWLYFLISFGSTLLLLIYHPSVSYKSYMWVPWSIVPYFTLFYVHFENKPKKLISIYFLLFFLFLITYFLLLSLSHSVILIHNKYPPNIFYLSYGLFILLALSYLLKFFVNNKIVSAVFNFFSVYSYQIFFLHYIILTVFATFITRLSLNWISYTSAVFGVTVILQLLFNEVIKRTRH
jgi:peptidoglycan/LPS O-acetylase OafA/YrhL